MIQHHLTDELLLDYAAGAMAPTGALLVASHLTLCPACRRRLETMDAVGAALMQPEPVTEPIDRLLTATLARLDDAVPAPAFDEDGVLPGPIARHVGRFSDLPWQWRFPGVEEVTLDVPTETLPARLFRLAAGGHVPRHEHRGAEHSLILTGGFTDDAGHFIRGDLSLREGGTVHEQRIDEGEPCVVLVVAERPFRPRSALAWLASVSRGF